MVAVVPAWYMDPDSEDNLCDCSHPSVHHELVESDQEMSYPCTRDDHFSSDEDGRMVLVEEACPCENYTPG